MAFYQPWLGGEVLFDWGIQAKPAASELKRCVISHYQQWNEEQLVTSAIL